MPILSQPESSGNDALPAFQLNYAHLASTHGRGVTTNHILHNIRTRNTPALTRAQRRQERSNRRALRRANATATTPAITAANTTTTPPVTTATHVNTSPAIRTNTISSSGAIYQSDILSTLSSANENSQDMTDGHETPVPGPTATVTPVTTPLPVTRATSQITPNPPSPTYPVVPLLCVASIDPTIITPIQDSRHEAKKSSEIDSLPLD